MKIASIADVKARLSEYVRSSEDELVVITRNGRPVAVLLGTSDDDEIERLALSRSRRVQEILEEARRQVRESGGIPHEEFWSQIEAEPTPS